MYLQMCKMTGIKFFITVAALFQEQNIGTYLMLINALIFHFPMEYNVAVFRKEAFSYIGMEGF